MKCKHLFGFLAKKSDVSVSVPKGNQTIREKYEVIRSLLEEGGVIFDEFFGGDTHIFKFHFISRDQTIQFPVTIEVDIRAEHCVCIISSYFPFYVDDDLLYPLCKEIVFLNCENRIGAIHYSPYDDDLYYQYSFHADELNKDTLAFVLNEVMHSAENAFETLGRYVRGEYTVEERDTIVRHTQMLLAELDFFDNGGM